MFFLNFHLYLNLLKIYIILLLSYLPSTNVRIYELHPLPWTYNPNASGSDAVGRATDFGPEL